MPDNVIPPSTGISGGQRFSAGEREPDEADPSFPADQSMIGSGLPAGGGAAGSSESGGKRDYVREEAEKAKFNERELHRDATDTGAGAAENRQDPHAPLFMDESAPR